MHIEQIANHNLKSLISRESAQALRFDNSIDWIAALRAPKIRELTTNSWGAEGGLKKTWFLALQVQVLVKFFVTLPEK
jgi:hypothetical protein